MYGQAKSHPISSLLSCIYCMYMFLCWILCALRSQYVWNHPRRRKESGRAICAAARPIHVRYSRVRLISSYGEPLDQEAFSCCHFVQFLCFLLVILGAYPAALGNNQMISKEPKENGYRRKKKLCSSSTRICVLDRN